MNTQTKHPHAELMMEYAKDAMETERPWERWEWKFTEQTRWSNVGPKELWLEGFDYRRKPPTITINGIEVPEPLREAPEHGTAVYEVDQTRVAELSWKYVWDAADTYLNDSLRRGMIHLTREAAEQHARALILASGGEV